MSVQDGLPCLETLRRALTSVAADFGSCSRPRGRVEDDPLDPLGCVQGEAADDPDAEGDADEAGPFDPHDVQHRKGMLDVVLDLVRAVGLVSESASEHVEGQASETLGQHGKVRAERFPMPACTVQHHKRWRVR
jgi:hypothetical protein